MRLYATFLILSFQLSYVFASPPNSLESSSQANHDLKGYECGNNFFTYNEVKEALSLARPSIDKGYRYPEIYRGPLYSESRYEEYYIYPIRNGPQLLPEVKNKYSVHYVVLTRKNNQEIGVVARITTGEYTKCIRRHNSYIGPSYSVSENANGYLCAHEFFPDDIIHQSLALAQNMNEGNPKYPSRYSGLLHPEQKGLLLWPILKGKTLYKQGETKIGPYYLMISNEKQFVDVVVRGYMHNYLRCIRSRKPQKAPASDPFSKLFVPPPKSGYLCGKVFFDGTLLEENAATAKSESGNAIRGKFPVEYSGPPFNERCLIWPLLQDGSLSRRGHRGPYRLILTSEHTVLTVAMFIKGKYKACERNTIVAKKDHDKSDYHCHSHHFSHQQLVKAAEEACNMMNTKSDNYYPARYQGPRFKLDGPYLTYPVSQKSVFGKSIRVPGLNRVVINKNCEVVGALTTLKVTHGDLILKRLVKCHRLADGPLPSGFYGANTETVFEYKIKKEIN